MEKKYQIFISSTFDDLREERDKVRDAILSMYQFPVGMELFGAASDEQWKIIQETIDTSDYYVLIVGQRYGTVIKEGPDKGISYTEKEFRYAKSRNIPILAFLIGDNVPVQPQNVETKYINEFKAFKETVKTGRTVVWWNNADHLATLVTAALYKEIERTPREGWVRSRDLGAYSNLRRRTDIGLYSSVRYMFNTSEEIGEEEKAKIASRSFSDVIDHVYECFKKYKYTTVTSSDQLNQYEIDTAVESLKNAMRQLYVFILLNKNKGNDLFAGMDVVNHYLCFAETEGLFSNFTPKQKRLSAVGEISAAACYYLDHFEYVLTKCKTSGSRQPNSVPNLSEQPQKTENERAVDKNVSGNKETFAELLRRAVEMAVADGTTSASLLQRRLRVGYARAGCLIDEMEKRGIISPSKSNKGWKTLMTREQYAEMYRDE